MNHVHIPPSLTHSLSIIPCQRTPFTSPHLCLWRSPHTDPDLQVNLSPLDSNSHTTLHLLLILTFSSPQLLKPFPCVSGTQDLTLSKISSKLKFFPNPPVFLNVQEETFIPIEDFDFLVAFSNGGCFCSVSLPLGTRLDRCPPSYSLQSQILNFIYYLHLSPSHFILWFTIPTPTLLFRILQIHGIYNISSGL